MDLCTRFANARLHLGICGSVAAYRAADLLRAWRRMNIHVSATLTRGARQFVSPLLFASLGASPVYTDMFTPDQDVFAHLEPGQHAQAMIVAPATADTLRRLAQGAADDMLAAQALAFDGPLVIAPAMNPRMWAHAATQANVRILASRGASIVQPDSGGTACGDTGQGRLAPLHQIFLAALHALCPQDMVGKRVLVTLGPTREQWDGVRYWSNPSSGRMGAALAVCAWLRGARVTAITGPGLALSLPGDLDLRPVCCAKEMFAVARDLWPEMDLGIFVAAVADFSPKPFGEKKFKKSSAPQGFSIDFLPNPDILQTLARERTSAQKVLGFAAESVDTPEDLLHLARAKLEAKHADILAANAINMPGSGFGTETNALAVVDARGRSELWSTASKADMAWDLCTWLLQS
ncbi:MAG: bifunctional phosphopantothenoylcysteine decarboxylase/phosphopantothenate--cysteine ligase CoaBC [Desulfovibrio sp.]|nr:bifunctional phosphopantothenoylcysteine decarboxylase/phosphopantothenate--cysteine ligase CoaBC [Desulfovibrio sp.]